MKICFKISLIWLLSQAECWKPISHPAAYTVYQTFTDHASQSVARGSNALQKNSVDSLLDSFNKNDFADDVSKSTETFYASQSNTFGYASVHRSS